MFQGPAHAGTLTVDLAQEKFQHAYVASVAAAAKCSSSDRVPDFDGVDLTLHHQMVVDGEPFFSSIDFQLKSTRVVKALKDGHIAYRLPRKQYDKLRTTNTDSPRLLVVILVPPDIENWLEQDEERLQLFRCAYWMSLRGMPPTKDDSITVHVPRKNIFSVEALCELFYRARAGLELGA